MNKQSVFNAVESVDGDSTLLKLSGAIDESAQFPKIKLKSNLKIDLSGVTRMNSIGVRTWCLWMQNFKPPAKIQLANCPVIMVNHFSLVKGFLSPCCQVESFAIPFYSENTDERQEVMAVFEKHFTDKGVHNVPRVLDSKGMAMEMDIIPESYFAFLRG